MTQERWVCIQYMYIETQQSIKYKPHIFIICIYKVLISCIFDESASPDSSFTLAVNISYTQPPNF